MRLQSLHVLLTYECNFECDHCFVWGSSRKNGTITMERLSGILGQAKECSDCEWVFFEGGEPFLYYSLLRWGVERAKGMGFKTGVVTNGYWAISTDDALECLKPFEHTLDALELSRDSYHGNDEGGDSALAAKRAAEQLSIPVSVITIAQPDLALDAAAIGHLPEGESRVMYRGRAARKLADPRSERPWLEFSECPHEDLREPGRLHVDPFGNLHVCQGIVVGNLFERPLAEICAEYDPEVHAVVGPLLNGGPADLARFPGVNIHKGYADACHLCYETRDQLRAQYSVELRPDQMYGDD